MLVITWFEEVAALNQSVPWVKFSQVLRATQQRTQLLTSHSYTGNNIQSPLWAWKISTRDTEGKELTGIAWHCLWYPFLGDFCTHHLLKRWRHLALTTTTTPSRVHFFWFFPTLPCFLCSERAGEETPPGSAAKSSTQETGFGTRLSTNSRLLTRQMPHSNGQFCPFYTQ